MRETVGVVEVGGSKRERERARERAREREREREREMLCFVMKRGTGGVWGELGVERTRSLITADILEFVCFCG